MVTKIHTALYSTGQAETFFLATILNSENNGYA